MAYSSTIARAQTIIFRPGTPADGLAVPTWETVRDFVDERQGACIILIDDTHAPAHVPAASGVTDGRGCLEIQPYRQDAENFATLVIDDGATLRGLFRASGSVFIQADTRSATPALDWDYSATAAGEPVPSLFLAECAALGTTVTATAPAIVVPSGKLLAIEFSSQGGVFVAPGTTLISLPDASSQALLTAYDGFLRNLDGSGVVPNTWVSGHGNAQFFYTSTTVYQSVGLPRFASDVSHYHDMDSHVVVMEFAANANDILNQLQLDGYLPTWGSLSIMVEGFGGTGGGGGGAGGDSGSGGGGSGGARCVVGTFSFDLTHRLDVTIGLAGAAGAAGVAGHGTGGNGGDGTPSLCTDGTTAAVLWAAIGSAGGRGGTSGSGGLGGPAQSNVGAPTSSAGFPSCGGAGHVAATPGDGGNGGDLSLFGITAPPSTGWIGGAGCASAGGQGGGGGGGGAGPRGAGAPGGNGSANIGGAGSSAAANLGGGAGGGAGGTGIADPGGPGGIGAVGWVRVTFNAL